MDFVLVFEEDKKDADIEIPKVNKEIELLFRFHYCIMFYYPRNLKGQSLVLQQQPNSLSKSLIIFIFHEICRELNCKFFFRKLGKKKQRFKLWRKKFLAGLQTVGLEIEDVSHHKSESMINYVKDATKSGMWNVES